MTSPNCDKRDKAQKSRISERGKNLNDSSLGLHCMDPIAYGTLQCSCSLQSNNFDRILPLLYNFWKKLLDHQNSFQK